MKLNKLFLGAMALSLMTACSDSDLSDGPKNGPDTEIKTENVSGYIAVEIKLPQETTTRGVNDSFSDGTANEYAVENGLIVVFKGEDGDEKNAKFYRAQELKKNFFNNSPTDDGITTSFKTAIEVKDTQADEGDEVFYALVILNRNDEKLTIDSDDDGNESITIAGKTFTEGNTFAEFLAHTTTNSFLSDPDEETGEYSRFFMTNAPLSPVPGGSVKPANLVDLGSDGKPKAKIQYLTNLGNKIYDTMDEAKEKVSGCVYVERAVAKVTSSCNKDGIKLYTVNAAGDKVELTEANGYRVNATVKHALTNTNLISHVIRNVDFTSTGSENHFSWDLVSDLTNTTTYKSLNYRMIGSEPMPGLSDPFHTTKPALYRTYWCKDPNYNKTEGMGTNKYVVADPSKDFKSISTPLYCKENTFDVANQNYGNTTLALYEVTFTVSVKTGENTWTDVANLFVKDGDNSKIYLTKDDAASDEITRIIKDTEIQKAVLLSIKDDVTEKKVSDFRECLNIELARNPGTQELYVLNVSLNPNGKNTGALFDNNSVQKFRAIVGNAAGTQEFDKYDDEGAVVKDEAGNTVRHTPTILKDLLAVVNDLNVITEFTGGKSYYMIPIQHFGDELTPFANEDWKGNTTSEVYETDKANHADRYLGRYGVVRNNWYDLNINSITELGSPTIPKIDGNLSDDHKEVKKYFAVEVHVLSWAKRTQGVKF